MNAHTAIGYRILVSFFAVLTLTGFCQSSHSVETGSIEGGVYHNLYFHLIYKSPSSTREVDVHTLPLPHDPTGNTVLLFAATESRNQDRASYPSGLVLYAENLAQYQGQVKTGADYVRNLMRAFPQNNYLNQQSIQTSAGITFYRIDYHPMEHEYDAAIAGVARGYALVFKFNSDSQDHLDNLVSSVSLIKNDR